MSTQVTVHSLIYDPAGINVCGRQRTQGGKIMQSLTDSQINTIIQLIRRGEYISHIAALLGVSVPAVEEVLDRYVSREMSA